MRSAGEHHWLQIEHLCWRAREDLSARMPSDRGPAAVVVSATLGKFGGRTKSLSAVTNGGGLENLTRLQCL
jgi:hypothetical protein